MAEDAMSPPPRLTSCYRPAKTPGLSIASSFTRRRKGAPRNHLTPITRILQPERPTARRKNTRTTGPPQAPRNQKTVSRVAGSVPILSPQESLSSRSAIFKGVDQRHPTRLDNVIGNTDGPPGIRPFTRENMNTGACGRSSSAIHNANLIIGETDP